MNRPTSAPEASESFGISLETITSRVPSFPVHGSRFLRSIVSVLSPVMVRIRSTITAMSDRPDSLASEMIATGLPISGHSPKFVARLESVGPATLSGPIMARRMRTIVSLPARFGPMRHKSFCCRVSPVRQ